ncbi:MAG: spinster family MFS transporter [Candidatus Binataceae bacterium]
MVEGKNARAEAASAAPEVGGRYAKYVLVVLVLVNVFNFLDRQLITILATDVRADLGLSDAEIGFLYGTAFAVFYAIFGIPLGKVADVWNRRSLIAYGVGFWSAMTALSGFASNFAMLAGARIGVGVGEASASPAAFSMLCDYFAPRRRATALSVYASGIYIGAGIGVFLGGWILDLWNTAYPPALGAAPLGLKGWQVAFLLVGLPGLGMAVWVRTLREPVTGMSEGLVSVARKIEYPLAAFWHELKVLLPGFSLAALAREGGGPRVIRINLTALAAIGATAFTLIILVGTPLQWIALGVGIYAAFSWVQGLARRDPPAFELIYRSRAMIYSAVGFSMLSFIGYGVGAFAPAFFMRVHGVSAGQVGTVVGLTAAVAGWIGVTAGGVLADWLKLRTRNARLVIGMIAASAPVPLAIWMLATNNTALAYVLNFPVTVGGSMWVGAAAATVQDLVLPRMRAVASANYLLCVTFLGLALGPYTVGRLSDALGDLRLAMILALSLNAVAVAFLWAARRHLAHDEDTRLDRARLAGEPPEAVAQAGVAR